jgi:hypothetical protein
MTDEQRANLVKMLGGINRDVDKNKAEAEYEEAEHRLHKFIGQQRIKPEDLPNHKVVKVVTGYDCMTIIADDGRYLHVTAEPGYEGCVDFDPYDELDIEDARDMGILSQEQYDEYQEAFQAHLDYRENARTKGRMETLVREIGAEAVQEYLNELSQ